MASPKSPQGHSPFSPRRMDEVPPLMPQLHPGQPVVGSAWDALLVGRTEQEMSAIVNRAAAMLLDKGSTTLPATHQQIEQVDGDRILVHRWTKATLAQFKLHALSTAGMVLRHDTQEIPSPVKGKQKSPCARRATPTSQAGCRETPANFPGLCP